MSLEKGKVVRLAIAFNGLKASSETRYVIYGWLQNSQPIKGHGLILSDSEYQVFLARVESFCRFLKTHNYSLDDYGKQYFYFQEWLKETNE
jgi:hypothetical protein